MKLSKSKLSKLHNKKAQTRKQRLVKKKQKERQRSGKKPKSILKTKRKYSRPFNLRCKTLRNVQKRKRDRKHNKPRKIRFLLKGGQEDQTKKTNTGIELTPNKEKNETVPERKSNVKQLSMTEKDLAIPILKETSEKIDRPEGLQSMNKKKSSTPPNRKNNEETKEGDETKHDDGPVLERLERLKRFQSLQNKQISKQTSTQEIKRRKPQDNIQLNNDRTKPKEIPKVAPPSYEQAISTTPSTEPVRTTMSTDENDDYKIITVKVYYPKKALGNVISDSGNSAAQTLNVLTSK